MVEEQQSAVDRDGEENGKHKKSFQTRFLSHSAPTLCAVTFSSSRSILTPQMGGSTRLITGGNGDNGYHLVSGFDNESEAGCGYMPFPHVGPMLNIGTPVLKMIMKS